MGSCSYSQCLLRCSRGLHFDLSTCLHRCTRVYIYLVPGCVPVSPGWTMVTVMRNGPRQSHERAAWYEEPVAGNQLVHELDQWRATHKGPLNFNGSCAMPLYLAYSFLAIKSAHSALPYATSLKHTRPIVNHLPCTQYSPLYIGLVACQFHQEQRWCNASLCYLSPFVYFAPCARMHAYISGPVETRR